MARMTEEEAWALDDYVTNNEIKLGPNGSGWLSQKEGHAPAHLVEVDAVSSAWLRTRAEATHKTTTEIIGELIREKIAVSV